MASSRADESIHREVPTGKIRAWDESASDRDAALLRAYEPVVRFTKGELFFPTAVAPYVEHCSLWSGVGGSESTLVAHPGELTLERLAAEGVRHRDRPLSLRFVAQPLGHSEYRKWRRIPRERLSATGRFTTTGMFGRLLDAGVRASLLLRGKVPAGLAAAAETTYREKLDRTQYTYYGRTIRDGGYICLQYWYFYAMNDWRSTFGGINDHEADWEMVTIFLAEQDHGPPRPAWVAFSSHDYHGDDLRRRWDDPELHREGNHPVVYAGAGSHSGAFIPGDYVVSVEPPRMQTLLRLLRKLQRLLAPWRHDTGSAGSVGIPFVDYARGDGLAVGDGHAATWTPVVIDDDTPWVRDYRGLWGLDTGDRFGGERAPSGPRYERDGSVRTSWANPLGWAGLLKVPPQDDLVPALERRVALLEQELSELDARIESERSALRSLRAEARSLGTHDYARTLADRRQVEVAQRETALNETIATRTSLLEERRAHLATLADPIPPERPQAHIRKRHLPHVEYQQRRTRFLRFWAAVSTPLMLGSIVVVLVASPLAAFTTVGALAVLFSGVESIARRRLLSFIGSLLLLALAVALIVGLLLLLHGHWRIVLSAVVGVAAVVLLLTNIRDAIRR